MEDWEQIAINEAKVKAEQEKEAKTKAIQEANQASLTKVTEQIHAMEASDDSSESSDSDDESVQSEGVVSSVASTNKETKGMLFTRVRARLAVMKFFKINNFRNEKKIMKRGKKMKTFVLQLSVFWDMSIRVKQRCWIR